MKKIIFSIAFLFFFFTSTIMAKNVFAVQGFTFDPPNSLSNSLLHVWKLDEATSSCGGKPDVLDNNCGGWNGSTIAPGVVCVNFDACNSAITTVTSGKLNNGRFFNGSQKVAFSDCLNEWDNSHCYSANWTLSAWVKPNVLPQAGVIINNGQKNDWCACGGSVGFGIANGTNMTTAGSRLTGFFGISGAVFISFDGGYTFNDTTTWHFVTMTNNGTYTLLYVDSVLTGSYAGGPTGILTSARIGNRNWVQGNNGAVEDYYYQGYVDEVISWGRALSQQEITNLYNAGVGNPLDSVAQPTITSTITNNNSVTPDALQQSVITITTQQTVTGANVTGITPSGASFTGFGGYNIGSEYAMINWAGTNAGKFRGYLGWSMQNFPLWTVSAAAQGQIPCAGGGYGGVYDGYGSQYVNLVKCSTTITGNYRSAQFTVTFNPSFVTPTSTNTVYGWARGFNYGSTGYTTDLNWTTIASSNTFSLSPLACSPPSSLVSWWNLNEASGSAVADNWGTNFGTATNPNPSFTNTGLNSGLVNYWNLSDNSGSNSSVESPPTLPNNLQSYWSLDEATGQLLTLVDKGPRALNLTTGSGGCGAGIYSSTGKIGSARSFNMASSPTTQAGCSGVISVGANSLSVTSNWTISAWIKPENTSQATAPLIHNGTIGTGYGFGMSGNQLIGYINNVSFGSGRTLDTNWHHVVMTRDASTTYLYLDNSLAGTSGSSPTAPDAFFILGGYGGFGYYAGQIDEVGTWNRFFPAADVTALFNSNAGCGMSVTSASPPAPSLGKLNAAQNFNGSNYLTASCLNTPNLTGNITISAWIRPNDLSGYHTIIAKRNNSSAQANYGLRTNGSNIDFYFANGGTWRVYTATANLTVGAWTQITATYNGSTVQVYKNNNTALTGSCGNCNVPLVTDANPVAIGKYGDSNGGGEYFNGQIDEMGIWNTVLTPTQIGQLTAGDFYQSSNTLSQTFTNTNLNTGLSGYWGLDDSANSVTAADSALGNSGTYNGTALLPYSQTPPSSKNINARSFNGTSDYINVPDSPSLQLSTNLTLSLWLKTTVSQPNAVPLRKSSSSGTSWGFYFDSSNKLTAQYYNPPSPGGNYTIHAINTFNDGNWHHAVLTVSGTSLSFFIDNVSQGSPITISGAQSSPNGALGIGAGTPSFGQPLQSFFNGQIDEVGIWNRALTSGANSEISALFAGDFLHPTRTSSRVTTGASTPALGNARVFNGASDFVKIPTNTTANNLSAKTVTAWINTTATGQNQQIFSTYNIASGWQIYLNGTGTFNLWAANGGTLNSNASAVGGWHHVGATFDGINAWNLYVDGQQKVFGTRSFATTTGDDQIGAECNSTNSTNCDSFFRGQIDEVRLYNAVLQQSEIQTEFQRGIVGTPTLGCCGNTVNGTFTCGAGGSCGTGTQSTTGTDTYCTAINSTQSCVIPGSSTGGQFKGTVMNVPVSSCTQFATQATCTGSCFWNGISCVLPTKVCATDQNTGSGSFGTICTDAAGQPGSPAAPNSYQINLPGLLPGPTTYNFSVSGVSGVLPTSAAASVTCGGTTNAPTFWFLSDAGVVSGSPTNTGAGSFSQSGSTVPPGYNLTPYVNLSPIANAGYDYLLATVFKNAQTGGTLTEATLKASANCSTGNGMAAISPTTNNNIGGTGQSQSFDFFCYTSTAGNFDSQLTNAINDINTNNIKILYPYNFTGTVAIGSSRTFAAGNNIISFIPGSLQVNAAAGSPIGISVPTNINTASAIFVMKYIDASNQGNLKTIGAVTRLDGMYIFPGVFDDNSDNNPSAPALVGNGSLLNTGSSAWTFNRPVAAGTGNPAEKWTYQPKYLTIYNNILSSAKYSWKELPPQ